MRIILKTTLLFLIITLLTVNSFAKIEPVVLLRGNVKDKDKGVVVDIQFKDESGVLIRSKSAADGTYQTVLKPGHKYQVLIIDDNLTRFTFTYDVPHYDKYTQLDQDFQLNAVPTEVQINADKPSKIKKNKSKKTKKGK